MAKLIRLKHKETGVEKQGIYGFSWTVLFFGPLPMVIRGDYLTFIGYFIIYALLVIGFTSLFGFGIGLVSAIVIDVICACKYNKYYTTRLLERGYQLAAEKTKNAEAALALDLGAAQAYFAEASTRKCPFCAEQVKAEAIVCRFCQRDLPSIETSTSETDETAPDVLDRSQAQSEERKKLMDRLGVEQKDGLFFYQGKGYPNLSDIPFGKKGG